MFRISHGNRPLLTDGFQLSNRSDSLQSLPLQALSALFPFLSARDYLSLSSLCKRFAALRISPALLSLWELRQIDPVHKCFIEFPRRGVIECMRAKQLENLDCHCLHYDVAVGQFSNVVAWGSVDSHLLLFSHIEDHLVIWEAMGERQDVYWKVECGANLRHVQVGSGKAGYITNSAIVILTLKWETKSKPVIQAFKTNDNIVTGSMHFFDTQRLVIARLNSWIYIFTEDLRPLRMFCEENLILAKRCLVPVHTSLPYIWLIGTTKVLVYDITKTAKTPIYSFSLPFLLTHRVESVFVKNDQRSRCYLITLNAKEGQAGKLYINSRVLSLDIFDFSICEDELFTITEQSSMLYQYEISVNGVRLFRSISLSDRFIKPQLLSFEYRLVVLDHCRSVKIFDYIGSLVHSYSLDDFQTSRVVRIEEKVLMIGKSVSTGLTATLVLHYWRGATTDPRVEVLARNLKQWQEQIDFKYEKAVKKKQELYLWERTQRRRARVAKKERKATRESRYWKSSVKQSLATADLKFDEFDML